MWNLFEKVKSNHTIAEIAKVLNVAPGTVSRWNTLKSVPESYRFDLMKMAGEKIDYTIYSPKDKDQFFTPDQIDQLRTLVDEEDLPVLCFGLRTDFLTHFFPGSQRLMELADSLTEIKTVCSCGRKATVNGRIDEQGNIITHGDQVFLGGNDSYIALCHKCWKKGQK